MALCNLPAPHGIGVAGLGCLRSQGHPGPCAAELIWTNDPLDSWAAIEPAPINPARAEHLDDEAPTQKLPPITETVRRRPPVPGGPRVTELTGAQLVEALMAELERERNGGEEL